MTAGSLRAADFRFVQRLVREATGVELTDGQEYVLESRLVGLLRSELLPDIAALVARLRLDERGPLRDAVVTALLNGETTFFRDPPCFDALRRVVLPRLIASRPDRRLDVWSAACSTGQEPYSLAMLLADSFPELDTWTVNILATDVSRTALDRAVAARYAQHEVNRGLPVRMLVAHFERDGETWVLDRRMRSRVRFHELNLTGHWPFAPRVDLVLLRNVMIYWALDTKQAVLARIKRCMRSDAVLVLGGAETTHYVDPEFTPIAGTHCCFARSP